MLPSPVPLSRRFQFRDSTKDDHAAVDAAVGSLDNIAHYRGYLRGQYMFRRTYEDALGAAHWPASFGSWRPRPLADLVADDIRDLGEVPPETSRRRALDPRDLWGALYVLVGSNLGSQLLVRRLEPLGLSERFGGRHLARQAGGLDEWRAFLALLEAAPDFDFERNRKSASVAFGDACRAFTATTPASA